MYCPSCRTEYTDGLMSCADCGESLVDELPPAGELVYEEWVTVEEAGDEAQAAVLVGYLEEHGIVVRQVQNNHIFPLPATDMSEIHVQVPEDALEEALEALRGLDDGDLDPDLETGSEDED